MTGTQYFSTDTDAIRHGAPARPGTVHGQQICRSCRRPIGLLDMWCPCQESQGSTGAEQARNPAALAMR